MCLLLGQNCLIGVWSGAITVECCDFDGFDYDGDYCYCYCYDGGGYRVMMEMVRVMVTWTERVIVGND